MQRTVIFLSILISLLISAVCDAQNTAITKSEFIFTEAPFEECHASTIESTPDGLVAAWFGGTEESNEDVEIWLSRNTGAGWSDPVSVADGVQHADKRYPTWNPVLFQVPDGKLMLFYKVGPNPREWWGALKTSGDYGQSWSRGYRLPEDILGPIKNKPIMTEDGRLISPSSTEHDGWRVHFEISPDTGKTWQLVGPINDAEEYDVIQPSILRHGGDTLQILARSKNNRIITSWSYDGGYSWSSLTPTELPNPNSGTDAVTLDNGHHLLVYNHSEKDEGEWGGPRTPLNVAVSEDGKQWHTVITLEDTPGEYSYPAVIQASDGLVHITYTWKRKQVKHVVLDPEKIDF
ncbi:exo-alpha-sialidase [Halalkalibaculum sp. DA384]|uniref:sialidase family protein n=1 Tax=Halalkalibaculum sp. DA384 TaxID=3373606 RepID=UPI0037553905